MSNDMERLPSVAPSFAGTARARNCLVFSPKTFVKTPND